MKFRKTLKVLAASALLFGTVGLATACGDNNGGTTDVKGLIINEDAKVIRGDFNLVDKYLGCDLTWTSSNENVAKITKGEGTYKVIITRPDKDTDVTLTATSGKYTKEFKITVPAIDVSEIAGAYTFANNKKTLKTGSYDLEAKATYSGKEATIAWAVDEAQASIAKVENGKLVITATAEKTTVTLKATFTYNNATSIKKYSVVAYDSPLGNPVLTVTPENFKTATGIKMDKVVENTAHPDEFTMSKQGSYMTAYSTKDIKQITIEVYGSYDNLKVYAGGSATGDAITSTSETISNGKKYTYQFAAGVNQFYIENPSNYAVQLFSLSVYTDGILSAVAPAHFDSTNFKSTSTVTFNEGVVENTKFPQEFTFNKKSDSTTAAMTVNNENGVAMIQAEVYGTYDNMKLYAGTDDKGTEVKATSSEKNAKGDAVIYTYVLPANTKAAYFVNPSAYAVQMYNIWVYEGTTIQQPKAETETVDYEKLFKGNYLEAAEVTLPEGVTAAVKDGTTATTVTIADGKVKINPTKDETVTLVLTAGDKKKEITFACIIKSENPVPSDAKSATISYTKPSANTNVNLDASIADYFSSDLFASIEVKKGTSTSTYVLASSSSFRLYANTEMVITAAEGKEFYNVEFTTAENKNGPYIVKVSEDHKTITIIASAQVRLTEIKVYYK
ncbi:MAG: hypothetical protein BHW10_09575 [Clostridium sp. CAG:307_30_263]|nr:MAG: hypothetical protein BHW10_09575 [Clostridium sp. CAG:307_30_263]